MQEIAKHIQDFKLELAKLKCKESIEAQDRIKDLIIAIEFWENIIGEEDEK
jgi:hypothetical protein